MLQCCSGRVLYFVVVCCMHCSGRVPKNSNEGEVRRDKLLRWYRLYPESSLSASYIDTYCYCVRLQRTA